MMGWFNQSSKSRQDSIGSSNSRNKSRCALRACLPDAPIRAKLLVNNEQCPDDSVTAAAADFWRPAQLSDPSPNVHSKWSAKAVFSNSFDDDAAPAWESWHLGWGRINTSYMGIKNNTIGGSTDTCGVTRFVRAGCKVYMFPPLHTASFRTRVHSANVQLDPFPKKAIQAHHKL